MPSSTKPFKVSSKWKTHLLPVLKLYLKSIPETTPDQWGAANRKYPASAGIPGPRNPWLTPYTIPFARSVASRRKRRVVLCVASQSGKTDTLLDIIGQRLEQRPVPILYVGPTKQFITEQFEPRVMALLDEAPSLAAKVIRGRRMTKTRKVVSGVPLRLGHAGSATALKSDPAGLAITDEVDALIANVKHQGDPTSLIDSRGDTYRDFVHAIVSTPSVGQKETYRDEATGLDFWLVQSNPDDMKSAVWKFWQAGNMYHWTWRCPHCNDRFVPRLSCFTYEGLAEGMLVTPTVARATARLRCPRCGCEITEEETRDLNADGLYVAPGQKLSEDQSKVLGEPPDSVTDSYWASGICSPFVSIGERAAAYAEARLSGDIEKVQAVVNGGFGECWAADFGDAPDWYAVAALRLPYKSGEIPEGVLFLTCGVDVQKRKLVYVVRGWGIRSESWLIEHGELHGSGDTRLDDIWVDLWTQVIDRDWGSNLKIMRAFIDSGFRPDDPALGDVNKVYEFVRRHRRICYATKGWDYRVQPISVAQIEVTAKGARPKFGLTIVHLDSDFTKDWVHARVAWPTDVAGGWHLPADATEDYCRQIGNEARMRKPGGGHVWVGRGQHDYLDAEAMCYAAARMLGLERLTDNARRSFPSPPSAPATAPAGSEDLPPSVPLATSPLAPRSQPAPPRQPSPQGAWLGRKGSSNWLRRY